MTLKELGPDSQSATSPGPARDTPRGHPPLTPLDEEACYAILVQLLHPRGLACPRCRTPDGLGVHRRRREPVVDYQCSRCGRVFNAWTGTVLEGTHHRPTALMKILSGMAHNLSTAQLARTLGCQRTQLHYLRCRLRRHVVLWRSQLVEDQLTWRL